MSRKILNIAMIGQGFIARAHANAFHQVTHFFDVPYDLRLKVICGRDEARLLAMAARWGSDEIATDWQQIVSRSDIDVVDIATPNLLHAPIALAAAEAGKIIFCEKPLAISLAEARQMASAVRNLPNLVWFNYRRVPAIAFARTLIDEGRLGQIYHYRALYLNQSGNDPAKTSGWRYQKQQAGSGAMGDLLSHSIDLALYLNGPISSITAMTHTFAPGRDVDDATLLLAKFANGSIGTFEASRYGVGFRNRNAFEINGSRGMLGFNQENMNRLCFLDATEAANLQGEREILVTGPNQPYSDTFWKPGHAIGYEHTFIATLGDFLDALSRGVPFHPNFEDAMEVERVLDAIQRSAESGVWVQNSA
ncbi:MAG TPA: Gfo/Idh/MocA family oxidoreductase [Terriglobales bacterium]|nr:Gfo/Idh/MocA family oxidoreductase [Terriglobales bacterium]